MRKTLALLAILALQAVPAHAKGGFSSTPEEQAQDHIRQTALIPMKLASFASGVVIGTPIAIVRCEAKRTDTYASSFKKEWDRNDQWVSPTMAMSIPGQTLRGPNSWRRCRKRCGQCTLRQSGSTIYRNGLQLEKA